MSAELLLGESLTLSGLFLYGHRDEHEPEFMLLFFTEFERNSCKITMENKVVRGCSRWFIFLAANIIKMQNFQVFLQVEFLHREQLLMSFGELLRTGCRRFMSRSKQTKQLSFAVAAHSRMFRIHFPCLSLFCCFWSFICQIREPEAL